MSNLHQQQQQQPPPPPHMMSSSPSTPLNLVSTEQIQKYLEENKNLIMAIIESQHKGKVTECAQYQAILQKNLMYLAAIADAQPQGPTMNPQLPTSGAAPQGNSHMLQNPASTVQLQSSSPIAKLPFQLNPLRPQDQQNQLHHFQQQQQLQGHLSLGGAANNGMHLMMQPGVGNPGNLRDLKGSQGSGLFDERKAGLGGGQGNRE